MPRPPSNQSNLKSIQLGHCQSDMPSALALVYLLGKVHKKIFPFSSYLLLRPLTPPPPLPLLVKWNFEILSRNFNVAMDAIGPETDFTLEKHGKM